MIVSKSFMNDSVQLYHIKREFSVVVVVVVVVVAILERFFQDTIFL